MRFSFALGLAIAGGAAVLFAGCSNGQSPGLTSGLPGSGVAPAQSRSSHAFILRSGVDTRYAALQPAAVISRVQPQAVPAKDLFVSDGGGTVQILKNKTYQNVGAITNGIDDSDGLWVDKAGNLYVANVVGKNVTEYAPGSSSPKCTYASGLVDPTGSIVVIAPPYTTATVLVSGLNDPFHDSLNKAETLLFNANNASANVTVYKYPSGTLVTTLGSGNGISTAEGVSDSPN